MTNKYSERYGGPYDRGAADSFYKRPRNPHCYEGDTRRSELVPQEKMTEGQIEAYNAGYDDNEALRNFKEYH